MKRIIGIVSCLTIVCVLFFILILYSINKYSVEDKEIRRQQLIATAGSDELTEDVVSHEICIALAKYTNWDNLFLSDNFKNKYKDRSNIIDDVREIEAVNCYPDYSEENVVVVLVEKKHKIFDRDESDDITTEYHFRYTINDKNEIDDLELLEEFDTYTIDGERVE